MIRITICDNNVKYISRRYRHHHHFSGDFIHITRTVNDGSIDTLFWATDSYAVPVVSVFCIVCGADAYEFEYGEV